MSRLILKDVPVGLRIACRRTGYRGTVLRNDSATGEARLRVRLDSGQRIDVRDDGSGELRWQTIRRRSLL